MHVLEDEEPSFSDLWRRNCYFIRLAVIKIFTTPAHLDGWVKTPHHGRLDPFVKLPRDRDGLIN